MTARVSIYEKLRLDDAGGNYGFYDDIAAAWGRNDQDHRYFCMDSGIVAASRIIGFIWENVQKPRGCMDFPHLYFHYARDTVNAAAVGCLFWSILYFPVCF